MSTSIERFTSRFHEEWLPRYCVSGSGRTPEGFRPDTLDRLTEHDAYWFLRAIDGGVVREENGFFRAPRSGANEQLVWTGERKIVPQPIYIWTEPIVTIAAAGRLVGEFGWSPSLLGMQTRAWAFDLTCYAHAGTTVALEVEVKSSRKGLDQLVAAMTAYGREPCLPAEPASGPARNAYRKVLSIRADWPPLLWVLGPAGEGRVFRVIREPGTDLFELRHTDHTALRAPWS